MYMSTLTFLEICSYISPGTSHDKWVKTYGAKLSKLWFPYEFFDTAEKLDFSGLSPSKEWFSKLKNEMTLSEEPHRACQRIWQEKGLRTFTDWLHFYNNLDFEPFLEALESMRDSYTGLGIDIFKDRYLCRESRWNISCVVRLKKEKPGVVRPRGGGLRNSQRRGCRGAEPGLMSKTIIRTHKFQDAKMCRRVPGYGVNETYPSTMEVVAHWAQTPRKVEKFIEILQRDRWFGFTEVDIEVPRELWTKFEEMPPLFYNKPVPSKTVPQHMKDYLAHSKRKPMHDQRKQVGALSAQKIML